MQLHPDGHLIASQAVCPIEGSKYLLYTDLNLPSSSHLCPLARPALWSLFLLPLTPIQR